MLKITLYGAGACPYAHRSGLVLAEQELSVEVVEVDLQNERSWFGNRVGIRKVPALDMAAGASLQLASAAQRWFNLPIKRPVFAAVERWSGRVKKRAGFKKWIDLSLTGAAAARSSHEPITVVSSYSQLPRHRSRRRRRRNRRE